jgi:hypothetical protein
MNYRKLQIAWSVGCGVLCLLLILLWLRSYWLFDSARLSSTTGAYTIASRNGGLSLDMYAGPEGLVLTHEYGRWTQLVWRDSISMASIAKCGGGHKLG